MGYSHYWCRPTELPTQAFAFAAKDFQKITGLLGIPLAGFDGTGDAICTGDAIVFNGVGAAKSEPFEVHQTEFDRDGSDAVRASCKTAHAPYDLAVQCALIILKHHLGRVFWVASDGEIAEWEHGRDVCQAVLGYGLEFQLDA